MKTKMTRVYFLYYEDGEFVGYKIRQVPFTMQ